MPQIFVGHRFLDTGFFINLVSFLIASDCWETQYAIFILYFLRFAQIVQIFLGRLLAGEDQKWIFRLSGIRP